MRRDNHPSKETRQLLRYAGNETPCVFRRRAHRAACRSSALASRSKIWERTGSFSASARALYRRYSVLLTEIVVSITLEVFLSRHQLTILAR